jgi:hypothetical protein
MSFYNTGNPVPSIDPRDLDDNAKILDEFVNGTVDTYTDRKGVERRTLFSIEHDANAATLRGDLAEPDGSGLVGVERVSPVSATPASAEFFFSTKKVSIWEYAKYLTGAHKPNVNDPNTWDWSPATALAGQLGKRLEFTDGTFLTDTFVLYPGTEVEGEGGDAFSPRTIIKSRAAGVKLITTSPSSSSIQRGSFSIEGVRLISDMAITSGDPTKLIQDAGGTSAYEMKTNVQWCSAAPITNYTGYACLLAKTFNHCIEHNDFTKFARGIVELGSDNGSIAFNRIIEYSEYGILQLSAGNFGSGTSIDANEILAGLAGSVGFKSTGRHIRVKPQYFERTPGVSVKGFVDISTIDAPTYSPNATPASTFFSVDVDIGRIDGEAQATDFINRFEPAGYSTRIRSVGTAGVRHASLPWLTVVGDSVPLFSVTNTTNGTLLRHEFSGSGERRWAEFRPESLRNLDGGVSFNNLSISSLNPAELRRNNAFLNVRVNDHSILLKAALSTTLFHCILPIVTVDGVSINNTWLRSATSYTITVIARMASGTGTLRCLKIVDAASQGTAVDTALTTQSQKITLTMTGAAETSKVGIAFAHNVANTTDIEILSVTFKEV